MDESSHVQTVTNDYRNAFWKIYHKHPNGRFFRCGHDKRLIDESWARVLGESPGTLLTHAGLFACVPGSIGYVVVEVATRDDVYLYSQIERIMGVPAFTTQMPHGSHLWYRIKPGEIFEFGSYSKPYGISIRCYSSPVGIKGTDTASHVVLWHPEQFDLNGHSDDTGVTAVQLEKLRQAEIRPKENKLQGDEHMDNNQHQSESYRQHFWNRIGNVFDGAFFRCHDNKRLFVPFTDFPAGEDRNVLLEHDGLFACVPASIGYAVVNVDRRDDKILADIVGMVGSPDFKTETPRGYHLWYRVVDNESAQSTWSAPWGGIRCDRAYVVLWHPEQFAPSTLNIVTRAHLYKLKTSEIFLSSPFTDDNVPKRVETRVGPPFEKSDDELRETEARWRISGYLRLFDSHVVALALLVRRYERILSQYDDEKVANKPSVGQMLRSVEDEVSNAIGRLGGMAENLENYLSGEDTETEVDA